MLKTKTMKKLFLIPILMLLWYNSSAQCPATVTITGAYTTAYTGSNSWIASSGVTTIPTGANVTLDANPTTNGYVLLDAGFETQTNSTFLAIVQTPCSLLGNEQFAANRFMLYPNPTTGVLNIEAKSTMNQIELFDTNGRTILKNTLDSQTSSLNMENLATGMYLIKVTTNDGSSTQKIVKQ
jgi:hypothetical protein